MNFDDLTLIQDQIGYVFSNEDLLQQAFIRRAYSNENGGENSAVLEFIGDTAVDLIVIKFLTDEFGYFNSATDDFNPKEDFDEFISQFRESKLTNIKISLVKKETLSKCIDDFGFAQYLIMNKGEFNDGVQESINVKSDLFRAIIGAIVLDSNWSLQKIEESIKIMLNPEKRLKPKEFNYVAELQEWSLTKHGAIPLSHFENTSIATSLFTPKHQYCIYGDKSADMQFSCELSIIDVDHDFIGYGHTKSIARKNAYELAYDYLYTNELLHSISDEIENPSLPMAISQLKVLAKRGYFSMPEYTFTEDQDEDGNPVWTCECHIAEKENVTSAISQFQSKAKKEAAFEMLKHVLAIQELQPTE